MALLGPFATEAIAQGECSGTTLCCPGVTVPTTLLLTITGKTGTCTCMPDTIELVYEQYAPDPLYWWRSESISCANDINFVFYCEYDELDPPSSVWVFGTRILDDVFFAGTQSCDPFTYTFDAMDWSTPLNSCTGSFTATVTFP